MYNSKAQYSINSKIIIPALLSLLFIPVFLSAQTLNCSDLKNGVFVSLSRADGSMSIYTRNGDMQKNSIR